ncbi:MAG: putative DNA binding domain-containing protein [Duodenibacillus sp.]|nr:putative DNA binding domain-containing protein [Oscillospiraceae bacterium]MCF0254173.1 putative DNA binding domain-containing protein [Duodenibacillus sp.]
MKMDLHEDDRTEFKREWSDTAKKTMIAFANDVGGVIYFGVSDDGEVIGCDFDAVDRSVRSFARNGVEPSILSLVRVQRILKGDKSLAVVYIAPGARRPYALRGKIFHEGGVFIRMGGQTVSAKLEEVMDLVRRGDPRGWESRTSLEQALTFGQAGKILSAAGIDFSETSYLGMGMLDDDRLYTNLALLLSDQNPKGVAVNYFGRGGSLVRTQTVEGSLLWQMQFLRGELETYNAPYINKLTGEQSRHETRPWPELALREALTSCLAHRDYDSPLQSSVNLRPSSISFYTVGGLPPQLPLQEALQIGISFCRNQRLAELFHRLGWMEKVGSGFEEILQAYRSTGLNPDFKVAGRSFVLELPRVAGIDSRETIVCDYLADAGGAGRTSKDIGAMLGASRPTVAALLKRLAREGLVVRGGAGRSVRYYAARPRRREGEA